MLELLKSWLNTMFSVVNGMFTLPIIDGVYLGYFILGILVFDIVISYIYARLH